MPKLSRHEDNIGSSEPDRPSCLTAFEPGMKPASEVQILPRETQELAEAEPGKERRREQRPVCRRGRAEQVRDTFPVEDPNLASLRLRAFASFELEDRVRREHPPTNCVSENATEDSKSLPGRSR